MVLVDYETIILWVLIGMVLGSIFGRIIHWLIDRETAKLRAISKARDKARFIEIITQTEGDNNGD